MGKIQKITDPKGQAMIVIPRKEYDRLLRIANTHAADDGISDAAMAKKELAKIKAGKTTLIPHDVVVAITVKGIHPVRAWRDYLDITATYLAHKSHISREMITMIETRKRKGTAEAYKMLAKALGVSVDALLLD